MPKFTRDEIKPGNWVVLCRLDRKDDGTPGDYTLATRSGFPSHADAAAYASGISITRQPLIAKLEIGHIGLRPTTNGRTT